MIIELFSLDVMAEALRAKIDRKSAISLQRGQFDPKFQEKGTFPTNNFCTDSYANEFPIGGGSYWAGRAAARPLLGPCGPPLYLARPLLRL